MTPSLPITAAFDRSVANYAERRPTTARFDASLGELVRLLRGNVAAVPILDRGEHLVGVVSRTDLAVLVAENARRVEDLVDVPRCSAGEIMTTDPVTIPFTATLRMAARAMAAHAIHQAYVVDEHDLVGVVTAMDIVAAVRDAALNAPLSTIATPCRRTIDRADTISVALDALRLASNGVLIVTADDRPVGTFTQIEALASRGLPPQTPIEDLYEPTLLCLDASVPLHKAASHMVRFDAQRIISCVDRSPAGIATTLDFVRYVAW